MRGSKSSPSQHFWQPKGIQKLLVMIKGTHSFKPPKNSGIIISIEKLFCTLVFYSQLITTGFMLLLLTFSNVLGFKLYEDRGNGRAAPHQLYIRYRGLVCTNREHRSVADTTPPWWKKHLFAIYLFTSPHWPYTNEIMSHNLIISSVYLGVSAFQKEKKVKRRNWWHNQL